MKSVINFGLLTILVAFGGAHPLGLAFQASPGTPSSVPHRPDSAALQQLLGGQDRVITDQDNGVNELGRDGQRELTDLARRE